MLDLSFIGKDGLIIQFEELISMTGYNVLLKLKSKNDKLRGMSDKDILLDYINREIENPSDYIRSTYQIDFPMDKVYQSPKALRPNLVYAHRMFDTAYKNGMRKLFVYSCEYSRVIEQFVQEAFGGINVQYIHGDIVQVMKDKVNSTFITSNTNVIRSCQNVDQPFMLMIVDDFMYVASVFDIVDSLRNKGIFVGFTGVLSAGVIP